jgi:hypothetical protein
MHADLSTASENELHGGSSLLDGWLVASQVRRKSIFLMPFVDVEFDEG